MTKILSRQWIQGIFNLTKTIFEDLAANIIPNGERLKIFPPLIRNKTRYMLSPLLFSIVLEDLIREICQEKKKKASSLGTAIVSNSLRPHGLWPTRLLRPWDSPGTSTGVGCPFLLQEIFPTQGQNPGLPHCRQTLYHLSLQGSLKDQVNQTKLLFIWRNHAQQLK